jgi:hypothetical protein
VYVLGDTHLTILKVAAPRPGERHGPGGNLPKSLRRLIRDRSRAPDSTGGYKHVPEAAVAWESPEPDWDAMEREEEPDWEALEREGA